MDQDSTPPDRIELLEHCIQAGSKKMRAAAFPLLARLLPERAEALAMEQADIGERSRRPRERAERFAFLVEVATSACLTRAVTLGVAAHSTRTSSQMRSHGFSAGSLANARLEIQHGGCATRRARSQFVTGLAVC